MSRSHSDHRSRNERKRKRHERKTLIKNANAAVVDLEKRNSELNDMLEREIEATSNAQRERDNVRYSMQRRLDDVNQELAEALRAKSSLENEVKVLREQIKQMRDKKPMIGPVGQLRARRVFIVDEE